MPTYEFRCRECDTVFEERRPMSESSAPATCPAGHTNTVRLLSVFASTVGRQSSTVSSGDVAAAMSSGGGGCCGGSCGCH
ncbi:MAG TPA: zinc ribbon domain-containing protein [Acidimicrobiales bacterium]